MLGFRPFTPADEPACLAICQAGVPKFFSPSDLADFRTFLAAPRGRFVVGELAGAVRACGGYHVRDDGTAGLAWGMVHPDDHRRGLGGELLRYRIARIREVRHARRIRLDTTPAVVGFFQRHGFVAVEVVPDGYGPGLDRVTLTLSWERT